MKADEQKKGLFLGIIDMILYGMFPVFAHYFVTRMDPLLFGGAATLAGSFPLLILLKKKNKLKDIYSKKFIKPMTAIVIATTLANVFFFLGAKLTSGINSGLLVQLEPFYAMLLGAIFLGEVIGIGQFIATSLMVMGAIVVVFKGLNNLNIGDLFILITPVFYQISHVFVKKIMNKISDMYIIPTSRMFYGGILLTVFAVIIHPNQVVQLFKVENIISILFFGFILRALDFSLWYEAMKRVPLSKLSAVLPVAAAVSFFLSIVFLKETANLKQYLGLGFILGGLVWMSYLQTKINVSKSK